MRDDLIDRVIEAKLRRLATLDPAALTASEWHSATALDHLSIHDTMNHTARPDGALCVERAPADRLPGIVALSNRGDLEGEVARERRGRACAPPIDGADHGSRPACASIGEAYRIAFDAEDPDDIAFNRPYIGGHETQVIGPRLRELEPRAVVRPDDGPARGLRFGSWQNEFLASSSSDRSRPRC